MTTNIYTSPSIKPTTFCLSIYLRGGLLSPPPRHPPAPAPSLSRQQSVRFHVVSCDCPRCRSAAVESVSAKLNTQQWPLSFLVFVGGQFSSCEQVGRERSSCQYQASSFTHDTSEQPHIFSCCSKSFPLCCFLFIFANILVWIITLAVGLRMHRAIYSVLIGSNVHHHFSTSPYPILKRALSGQLKQSLASSQISSSYLWPLIVPLAKLLLLWDTKMLFLGQQTGMKRSVPLGSDSLHN